MRSNRLSTIMGLAAMMGGFGGIGGGWCGPTPERFPGPEAPPSKDPPPDDDVKEPGPWMSQEEASKSRNKEFHDIQLASGEIIECCWPNAGYWNPMHPYIKNAGKYSEDDVAQVRRCVHPTQIERPVPDHRLPSWRKADPRVSRVTGKSPADVERLLAARTKQERKKAAREAQRQASCQK